MLIAQGDVHLLPSLAELFGGVILFPVVVLGLSIYAAKDMTRRGHPGFLYGLLIFFTVPVGLVVWLIMRSRTPTESTSASTVKPHR